MFERTILEGARLRLLELHQAEALFDARKVAGRLLERAID